MMLNGFVGLGYIGLRRSLKRVVTGVSGRLAFC
jgi:hypothetical protein